MEGGGGGVIIAKGSQESPGFLSWPRPQLPRHLFSRLGIISPPPNTSPLSSSFSVPCPCVGGRIPWLSVGPRLWKARASPLGTGRQNRERQFPLRVLLRRPARPVSGGSQGFPFLLPKVPPELLGGDTSPPRESPESPLATGLLLGGQGSLAFNVAPPPTSRTRTRLPVA